MKCIECGAECERQVVCRKCEETLERIRKLIKAYWILGVPQMIGGEGRERNA